MVLELREVNSETDFPVIARCMFESYENLPQKFFHAYFPVHGSGPEAQDPTSYWQKVVGTNTGRFAGGALWNIHKENPFAEGHDMRIDWFPDDGSRRFAEQVAEEHGAPRARVGQRPQICKRVLLIVKPKRTGLIKDQDLFIVFTHADYRHKGVAQQFMDWGMAKADETGVEMFLDSTPLGRPLYEKNGFMYVEKNVISPRTDSPDEAWKETVEKAGDHSDWWLMWRPVRGKYEEKTVKPWEKS
ncbi:hypothetical protein AAE478_004778 [Parahypoxylon ruwenzoriense]